MMFWPEGLVKRVGFASAQNERKVRFVKGASSGGRQRRAKPSIAPKHTSLSRRGFGVPALARSMRTREAIGKSSRCHRPAADTIDSLGTRRPPGPASAYHDAPEGLLLH
jgi:hypothetical protein